MEDYVSFWLNDRLQGFSLVQREIHINSVLIEGYHIINYNYEGSKKNIHNKIKFDKRLERDLYNKNKWLEDYIDNQISY